ncbi:hypothetical protein RA269_29470, partial [Pseudomonas syringae pv. tagetis]|uniref:hypothetical protein n=1 Tax=Pseudomonas syringae group genomosp. 7 TaxID=251699 RepID=UPI00377050EC
QSGRVKAHNPHRARHPPPQGGGAHQPRRGGGGGGVVGGRAEGRGGEGKRLGWGRRRRLAEALNLVMQKEQHEQEQNQ